MGIDRGTGQNSIRSKEHNRGLVLQLIATGECSSRVELAKATGLAKMTVTNIISDFIAQGLVEECEEEQTESCGRNPIRLQLSSSGPRVVGLLILKDRIEAVLCSITLEILKTEEISFVRLEQQQIQFYVCEVLDRLLAEERNILGIGVAYGIPADVQQFLEERYRLPVAADYDCNSAALAEKLFGAGKDAQDFIFLAAADHIGSGIVSGGRVYHNPWGMRSALGHMSIDRNGPTCSCGGRGCLEMYAGTNVVLGKLCRAAGWKMRFPQFCRLSGVAEIEEIMAEMVKNFSVALISSINLLRPELIILGKDCLDWDDRHVQMLEEAVNRGLADSGRAVPVRRAGFGRSAPLVGAAANVVYQLFQGRLLFTAADE